MTLVVMQPKEKEWRREFFAATEEVGPALSWVESVGKSLNLGEDQSYAILLCAEELLVNIVRHGAASRSSSAPAEKPVISISLEAKNDRISLVIEDNGPLFDVASAKSRRVDQPLEQVQPGGLGIHLVKRFADKVDYARIEGVNRVTLEFMNSKAAHGGAAVG